MTKVTYLDHSGFAVQLPEALLVFDMCKDPSHAVHKILEHNPELPVVFFVTHRHSDHYSHSIYEIEQNHRRTYVLSNDIPAQEIPSGLQVAGMSAGDVITLPEGMTVKAYPSTDEGVSYLVTTKSGNTIFHAGDLNEWHWKDESTPKEVEKAKNDYHKALNRISGEHSAIDIAMLPVDPRLGSDFGEGALEFMKAIKVANFFPMHFWGMQKEVEAWIASLPQGLTHAHCLVKSGESVEIA